jgi:cyclophilin family peptidyl-prolyl cis-trans isomerase
MSVLVETSLGSLTVDLFTEQCPKACLNFLKLCKLKYYHGCLFFSVQRDFIVQTGDPTGTGKGGSSVFGSVHRCLVRCSRTVAGRWRHAFRRGAWARGWEAVC